LIQHPELEGIWEDLEKIEPAKVIPIEQPAALKLPLLPFQKYGVGWMLQQERLDTVSTFIECYEDVTLIQVFASLKAVSWLMKWVWARRFKPLHYC